MSSLHQAPGGPGGEGGGYLHLALDLDTCTCCSPLASRWRLGGLGGWLQVCPGTNVLSSAADLKRSASPDCQSLRLDSLYLQEIPGEFETDGPQFRKKLQSNIIAKDCLYHDLSIDDISTVYLYRRHNPTTLQKNLHLNQKGVMNQLLASI